MAVQDLAAARGFQRFGLGFRLGQPESTRRDARELMLAEVQRREVAQPAFATGTAELGAALYAFEDRVAGARRRPPLISSTDAPPTPEPHYPTTVFRQEVAARFALATEAQTGLAERLVQFWSNHFCVAVTKSNISYTMAGALEREAIRPHVFGRFEDMLVAVISHPAMLDFLDNRISIGPGSPAGKRRGRGLNENLAREILELHTLGVSGGYSQADVTSLARIITGWTVVGREAVLGFPGSFAFNINWHEPGAHPLLGISYAQPGKEQGLAALAALAHHPSTAQFLARKLVAHFVADAPPPRLVTRLADTFSSSGGDLAAVTKALLEDDEAWSTPPVKIRSPQEFLIAAFRALGRTPTFPEGHSRLVTMGQPLWHAGGPNGYPDTNAAWAAAEGLKTRADVAMGWGWQYAGSTPDPRGWSEMVLGPLASAETRQAVARAASKPQALALLLMSPEFQRR